MELYNSPKRKTVPLLFDGLPDGLARSGLRGRVPSPPFDRQAWLEDLVELKKFMAIGYANFDWMIETGRVDAAQLEAEVKAHLQDARSDTEALIALKNFIAAFDDPHLKIELNAESKSSDEATVLDRSMTGDQACAALGFKSKPKDFTFPTKREVGFDVATSAAESFPYGTLEVGSRKVGVVRIASFLETHYSVLCARSWERLKKTVRATCDSKCQERYIVEYVENGLLTEFHDVLENLKKRQIEGLLLDVTGNGGGTDWEAGIARMITPRKLVCGSRGFIKHDHHAKRLIEHRAEVLKDLKASKSKSQAALKSKLKEIEDDLAAIAQHCDRSDIWSDPQLATTCPLVVKRQELDCSPDSSYCFKVGVYRGPLFILANSRSSSATEDLIARHKDSGAALVIGERTNGAGCGYINGGISTVLPHSKLKVRVPDCVRLLTSGENEVGGIAPDIEMNMKNMASEAFVRTLAATISDALAHKLRRLRFILGVQLDGTPSAAWSQAIEDRIEPLQWEQIVSTKKTLTSAEREWMDKIKNEASAWWQVDVLKLHQPFLPTVTPPPSLQIVFGNQGGDDGFTGNGPFIYIDLSRWVGSYGSATSDNAGLRIRRILSHEYTHLLSKSLTHTLRWSVKSPLDQVLWEMFHEGLGNYHSLSDRWVTPKGTLTAHANETLDHLTPLLVDHLIGIKNAVNEAEVKRLMKELSAGPFDQKWGALPVALWLRQEAKGNYGMLNEWIAKGPEGIRELLQLHLSDSLKSRLGSL